MIEKAEILKLEGGLQVVCFLPPGSVVHEPPESAFPESLMAMQNLIPHPRPTESQSAFSKDLQAVHTHNND